MLNLLQNRFHSIHSIQAEVTINKQDTCLCEYEEMVMSGFEFQQKIDPAYYCPLEIGQEVSFPAQI